MLEAVEKSYALLVGREKEAAPLEAVLQSDTELPYDPEIPIPKHIPEKKENIRPHKTCT